MARTQAVYYRDSRGTEPVDEFIQSLPPKRAAKIDDFVEEYLNGQTPDGRPPTAAAAGRRQRRTAPKPTTMINLSKWIN